jgi:hypothetical protein
MVSEMWVLRVWYEITNGAHSTTDLRKGAVSMQKQIQDDIVSQGGFMKEGELVWIPYHKIIQVKLVSIPVEGV